MSGHRSRFRSGPRGHAAALLVLAVQLLAGALPHREPAPESRDRLAAAAEAGRSGHRHQCPACTLAHAPAVPAVASAVCRPRTETPLALTPAPVAGCSAGRTTTRSRAPPASAV